MKWAQQDKTQSRELSSLFICVCIALCTIVSHNTAQKRPDNFPSCPPHNHHCSDDVYLREGGVLLNRGLPSSDLILGYKCVSYYFSKIYNTRYIFYDKKRKKNTAIPHHNWYGRHEA